MPIRPFTAGMKSKTSKYDELIENVLKETHISGIRSSLPQKLIEYRIHTWRIFTWFVARQATHVCIDFTLAERENCFSFIFPPGRGIAWPISFARVKWACEMIDIEDWRICVCAYKDKFVPPPFENGERHVSWIGYEQNVANWIFEKEKKISDAATSPSSCVTHRHSRMIFWFEANEFSSFFHIFDCCVLVAQIGDRDDTPAERTLTLSSYTVVRSEFTHAIHPLCGVNIPRVHLNDPRHGFDALKVWPECNLITQTPFKSTGSNLFAQKATGFFSLAMHACDDIAAAWMYAFSTFRFSPIVRIQQRRQQPQKINRVMSHARNVASASCNSNHRQSGHAPSSQSAHKLSPSIDRAHKIFLTFTFMPSLSMPKTNNKSNAFCRN